MLLALAQTPTAAAESLAHAIRLSMAPAFLLVGVGGLMGVMTTQRLKIVERYRVLHAVRDTGEDLVSADQISCELRVLQRRLRLTMQAITLLTLVVMIISLVIAILFISVISQIDLTLALVPLFVLAMLGLILASALFLLQLRVSWQQAVRVGVAV